MKKTSLILILVAIIGFSCKPKKITQNITATQTIITPENQDSIKVENIACGCEKIMQAWYAFDNKTKEYTSLNDAYTDIFGPNTCNGLDLDLALNHCLQIFGGNVQAGKDKYHPTLKFTQTQKNQIQNLPFNPQYANTIDKLADCPCSQGCLKIIDCCACKNLMEEELLYNALPPGTFPNFTAYLKNKFGSSMGSPMPGFEDLLAECKSLWEQGHGLDANKNPIPFTTGSDPCADGLTANMTKAAGIQFDLLIPQQLSCDPSPCDNGVIEVDEDGPGGVGHGTKGSKSISNPTLDCSVISAMINGYLSANPQPSITGMNLRAGCNDPLLKVVASYAKMRSEKAQNINNPTLETWFNNMLTNVKSQWMASPYNKPPSYANLEQFMAQILDCATPCSDDFGDKPCRGTNDCNLCYEIDYAYLADFQLYLNQVGNKVGHSKYISNLNFEKNYIDQLFSIPNVTTGPFNKVSSHNWNLQNPGQTVNVDKYYGSTILYPINTFVAQLKYYLTEQNITYGNHVNINDANGHDMGYSMNYPSDDRQNNLGEIVSFSNIQLEKPMACYYPTKYTIDAYQIVPAKYRNRDGVLPLDYMGQTLFYYQKTTMYGYFDSLPVIIK